jgi:DNA-directed RNA polymerase specialized sigma subunit
VLPTAVNGRNHEGTAEAALRRCGWSGERLQKEAGRIASDYVSAHIPYLSGDRREDLSSFLVLGALRAVLRFDPERATTSYGSNGGDHFSSYICDVMEHRCIDWFRSKAEGNGDRRYGNENRIVLSAMENEEDKADPDVSFEGLISERRVARWQAAADRVGLSLADFVVVTLDKAATALGADAYSTPKRPGMAPHSHAERLPAAARKPA